MADFKEYRSVTEFPRHTEKLSREELEAAYQDLRSTYRNLGISRGQLVRRQTEAKERIMGMNRDLQHLKQTLQKVEEEKLRLQDSLVHSVELRKQLQSWGDELATEVDELTAKMAATTRLFEEFEAVYEEVSQDNNVLSFWERLRRLLAAAQRLLSTDLEDLKPKKMITQEKEEWMDGGTRQNNRSLLDR